LVSAILIAPIGGLVGYLTLPWIGHMVTFTIGWSVGGSNWFLNIVLSIWYFEYD
jgi:hypothetical protein